MSAFFSPAGYENRQMDPDPERDPTWRKSDKVGEKVNFVGEKNYSWAAAGSSHGSLEAM